MSQLNVQQGLHQKERRRSDAGGIIGLLTMDSLDARQISTNTWAILIFLGYIIIGVAFYSLGPRQLSALDAVYLAVITFSTVGYGDIQIQYRYFACFYVLLGVAVVGTFFGIFSNDIMEAQEEAMQKRLVQVAKRIDVMFYDSARQLNDYRKKKMTEMGDYIRNSGKQPPEQAEEVVSEMRKANLEAFDEELREIRSKGIVDFFFILVAIFSGCLCMVLIEGWSFEQGLYWAIVTVTTVGYGDVTPDTDAGKIFTIFYVCIGCSLAAKGFRDFVCYPLVLRAKENETKIIEQFGENLSERTLRSILSCDLLHKIPRLQLDSKQMTKSEFTVLVLRLMNKVQEKDILLASQIFDRLDIAQDGILSETDQADQIAKARKRDREKQIEIQRKLAEEAQNERGHRITDLLSNLLVNPLAAAGPTTTTHHSYVGLVGENVSNPVHSKRKSSKIIEEEEVEDPFARRERRSVSWTPNTTPAAIIDEEDDDDQL